MKRTRDCSVAVKKCAQVNQLEPHICLVTCILLLDHFFASFKSRCGGEPTVRKQLGVVRALDPIRIRPPARKGGGGQNLFLKERMHTRCKSQGVRGDKESVILSSRHRRVLQQSTRTSSGAKFGGALLAVNRRERHQVQVSITGAPLMPEGAGINY
ncbi:hypothetical protein NDU88_005643 [Pleurodeles waltl]|uniref:Uncharacterized protein n=1 Tax=Pleurodeles waltl TaxID=8319 RepID=A0AAV7QG96_PLEWA|nr:hypothetical protein NDU88_005643 [Pleurodeles waltl]